MGVGRGRAVGGLWPSDIEPSSLSRDPSDSGSQVLMCRNERDQIKVMTCESKYGTISLITCRIVTVAMAADQETTKDPSGAVTQTNLRLKMVIQPQVQRGDAPGTRGLAMIGTQQRSPACCPRNMPAIQEADVAIRSATYVWSLIETMNFPPPAATCSDR